MTDIFGRSITVTTSSGLDTYRVAGSDGAQDFTVSVATGTPVDTVMRAINSMAPEGWTPSQVTEG